MWTGLFILAVGYGDTMGPRTGPCLRSQKSGKNTRLRNCCSATKLRGAGELKAEKEIAIKADHVMTGSHWTCCPIKALNQPK